ncbi:hypothetical protein AB8A21_04860 [Streptomyces sp. BF23-18]
MTRPSGMAVQGDQILMLGGGSRNRRDRQHRCHITVDEAVVIDEAELTMPNGTPLKRYARPVGRGACLYLRGASARQWYVLTM